MEDLLLNEEKKVDSPPPAQQDMLEPLIPLIKKEIRKYKLKAGEAAIQRLKVHTSPFLTLRRT